MQKSEHNQYKKVVRMGRSAYSALQQGHKSNRLIIDAQMAFFGTGCIINEQVILQDQEGVLAWVSERLAVAMRQAEDLILRDYIVSAASTINAAGGANGDNPTNLGVSDFSLVVATLDKHCVESKPLIIDLKLLAA